MSAVEEGRPSWVTAPGWPRAAKESADLCDAAADLIWEHGWNQGRLWPGSGEWKPGLPLCLVGAMKVARDAYRARVSLTDRDARAAIRDARAMIHRLAGTGFLPRWNDADGRTADDVIELLRRSAKELREIEGGGS